MLIIAIYILGNNIKIGLKLLTWQVTVLNAMYLAQNNVTLATKLSNAYRK